MTDTHPFRLWRILVVLALVLCCLSAAALPLAAAEATPDGVSSGVFLQADFLYRVASNRARMIQVGLVVVAFGCAIMWWYR